MPVQMIVEGAVAKVVLNRPEKMNALTWEMRERMRDYFQEIRFNDAIRAVIVTGEGRAFCAGADVDRMGDAGIKAARFRLQRGSHSVIRHLHAIEKPTIAAVRGHAVGVGWSIALACDITVASEDAKFSQIFRRIALAPDGGAIWFLNQRLGMNRAKELVYSARIVEAQEALSLGLVNFVVPNDELMAKAEALAADYASGPTFALGLAKKLFHMANGSLEDYLEVENMVQPQLNNSPDHQEGKAAFREKRRPNYTGN
jgi:2-(1,2-epoxy-1,2-dihydrophenyl)acetyl-CoA isomerase